MDPSTPLNLVYYLSIHTMERDYEVNKFSYYIYLIKKAKSATVLAKNFVGH
jgi:hypothetical protein